MTQAVPSLLDHPIDQFVADRLPTWLRRASPGQLKKLRDCFAAHRASHAHLKTGMAALPTPQQFAQREYAALLEGLGIDSRLPSLQWLEIRRRFSVPVDGGLPVDEVLPVRTPALLRLMQNFHAGEPFYLGSGLVAVGSDQVLSGDPNAFARQCRALDLGQRYQVLLAQQASPAVRASLAEHKRTGFALAVELAALRGHLDGQQHAVLRAIAQRHAVPGLDTQHGYVGQLKMLRCLIGDCLLVQMRDQDGADLGVVLYLPDAGYQALRHFPDMSQLQRALVADLGVIEQCRRMAERVALSARAAFTQTLVKRLQDAASDLELEGVVTPGDVFAHLADEHVKRLQDDARWLLVSNADADASDAQARLARWQGIAMDAAGVAGLFVPMLGALLLGHLLVEVTRHAYDGVADWARGHQHEAVEHLLSVAHTVVVTAVSVAAVGAVATAIARSGFIENLQPVADDARQARLWQPDLAPYEVSAEQPVLQDNGLFLDQGRRLLRIDGRFYEVYRPVADGPWRLRHPSGHALIEPELQSNGERCWLLRCEQPMDWSDSARMLERLWPSDPALAPERAAQVLQAAGVDQQELRGLLVENRPLPVNLRDTMRRFEADARIERFMAGLHQSLQGFDDAPVLQWCKARPGMHGLDEAQIAGRLLENPASWRGELFDVLAAPALADEPMSVLLARDFPGLPPAYAAEALQGLEPRVQRVAEEVGRVPLAVAGRARALLTLARVNRAIEGLCLRNSYTSGTGELVFALLRRWPSWPAQVNLELRAGTESGPLLAVLDPQGPAAARTVLVERLGRFSLYDSRGLPSEAEIDEPASVFDALRAVLTPEQRDSLGLAGDNASQRFKALLLERLPIRRDEVMHLLGWHDSAPWRNPGVRMSDGRVGYPLGGRSSRQRGVAGTLRQRVRALYPSFNEAQQDAFLQRMLREEGPVFDYLLMQERNYAQLDRALIRWQGQANRQVRLQRLHAGNLIRAAWRLEGDVLIGHDGRNGSLRLNLSGWRINQLPTLPAEVDLSPVGELVMGGLDLEQVPGSFLQCFGRLHTLVVTNNRLTTIPAGLMYLSELRHLTLTANRIRMTASNRQVLATLSRLQSLNLSHNPLRNLELQFEQPSQLRHLCLGYCGLTRVPEGLEGCEYLEFADLSDNQISDIPAPLMQMPWAFRARINLNHNPLSVMAREAFFGIDQHGVVVRQPRPIGQESEAWLGALPATDRASRSALWWRVRSQEGSAGLFELLGALTETSDFTQAREYVQAQVWRLLEALDQDQALQRQLFVSAVEPRGCVDSVAERFSRLQIEMMVFEAAQRSAEPEAGAQLLDLGRRLFRLECVDRLAFQAVRERQLAGEHVDDLEVVLGYRIYLAEALRLPGQPRSMTFTHLAAITPDRERAALQAVRDEETTDALAQSVARRAFWVAYLRERHQVAFTGIDELFATRGTELDEQMESLNSEDYRRRWDELAAEREASRHDLVLFLTREALEEAEPGQTAHRD